MERLSTRNLCIHSWSSHWNVLYSCAVYRHSGFRYLSPIAKHSGTGLVQASAFFFIPLPAGLDAGPAGVRHSRTYKHYMKVERRKPCTSIAGQCRTNPSPAVPYWPLKGPDTPMPLRDWCSWLPEKNVDAGLSFSRALRHSGTRHLLMICQYHNASLTPPLAVYERAGCVPVQCPPPAVDTGTMDVQVIVPTWFQLQQCVGGGGASKMSDIPCKIFWSSRPRAVLSFEYRTLNTFTIRKTV
jgi:hypothetical protein